MALQTGIRFIYCLYGQLLSRNNVKKEPGIGFESVLLV